MKTMTKVILAGVLLAAAVVQTGAQESNITVTVSAQNLNIALTGWAQGGGDNNNNATATKVRITTKDITHALGGGSKSRLLLLVPVDFEGDTTVVLRDVVNKQNVDTDVTGAFSSETLAVVESSRSTGNGKTTGTQYSIDTFTYSAGGDETTPAPVTFNVQGFSTTKLPSGAFNSNVNGLGTVNGADAVLSGKISTAAGKQETMTIPAPGE
jgi:hypothetical protein